jgi:hypothetical protein
MLNLKEGEVLRNVATQAVFLIPFRPYPKNVVLQEMRWESGSCTEQYDSWRETLQCGTICSCSPERRCIAGAPQAPRKYVLLEMKIDTVSFGILYYYYYYFLKCKWVFNRWQWYYNKTQHTNNTHQTKQHTTLKQNTSYKTTQTIKDTLHTMNTIQIQLQLQLNININKR